MFLQAPLTICMTMKSFCPSHQPPPKMSCTLISHTHTQTHTLARFSASSVHDTNPPPAPPLRPRRDRHQVVPVHRNSVQSPLGSESPLFLFLFFCGKEKKHKRLRRVHFFIRSQAPSSDTSCMPHFLSFEVFTFLLQTIGFPFRELGLG